MSLKLCGKGCGRPAFRNFATCCVRCDGTPGGHNHDCASKAAELTRAMEEWRSAERTRWWFLTTMSWMPSTDNKRARDTAHSEAASSKAARVELGAGAAEEETTLDTTQLEAQVRRLAPGDKAKEADHVGQGTVGPLLNSSTLEHALAHLRSVDPKLAPLIERRGICGSAVNLVWLIPHRV